ncbi:MAG: hypothetical protein CVU99_10560 [Firmicutes bacterium HGW-Firmicutes-4]|jgi:hypothetical protein|nr:MAG: hypothetical protein CVU99_10560 [Firmicutes bacterium HGW-Firmicutes-4]
MRKRLVLILIVAVALPLFGGWGPERKTYTMENPSPVVTFNSITDNPNYGDERNFVSIKSADNQNSGGWSDEIAIKKSGKYYLRIYIANSSADNLYQIAKNTKIRFNIPDYESNRIQIDGYIESDNSSPTMIYDQAVFKSDKKFRIEYIPGSAECTNNKFTDGIQLSDDIKNSNGVLVGYDQMNGDFPPGYKYDAIVIAEVNVIVEDQDPIPFAGLLGDLAVAVLLGTILVFIAIMLKKRRDLRK